jgi:16S rRNA (cytosine967-C5)-methyltransferase
VGAGAGERVADLCAAPGGKATGIAAGGAYVLASDLDPARTAVVLDNVGRLGTSDVGVVVADGTRPPWRPGSVDRVLVDAPCSGLGVLRRRPDARWRATPADVDRLVPLQRRLLDAGAALLRPGGTLVYSVCTITRAETLGIDDWLAADHPDLEPVAHLGERWRPHGRGDLLLPQDAGTDGMFCLRLRRRTG